MDTTTDETKPAWPTALASRFAIAPQNPRAGRKKIEALDEITANIAAHGVLTPVIVYEEGAKLMATAGRRRIAGAKKAGVEIPFDLRDKEDAIAAGLAEQDSHVPMHVADQVKAFAAKAERGASVIEIANEYGLTERTVKQRLALGSLHPPILEALSKDKLSLKAAMAYANAPADKQALVWEKLKGQRQGNVYSIADEFNDERFDSEDRVAKFVGEQAYVAAGGRLDEDLFSAADLDIGGYGRNQKPVKVWLDRDIAERLARERLEAAAEELKTEGWAWIDVTLDDPDEVADAWGDDAAYTQDGDAYGAAMLTKRTTAPRPDTSKHGLLIGLHYDGKIHRAEWLQRCADVPTEESDDPIDVREVEGRHHPADHAEIDGEIDEDLDADGDDDGGVRPIDARPQADARPGMTNGTFEELTRIAGAVLARELANDVDAGLIILAGSLADLVWSEHGHASGGLLAIERPYRLREDERADEALNADGAFDNDLSLPARAAKFETLYRSAADVSPDFAGLALARELAHPHRLELLAVLCGLLVATRVQRAPYMDTTRARLLAEAGGSFCRSITAFYTPDAALMKGFDTETLANCAGELDLKPMKTKTRTAEAIATAAAVKGWVPSILRKMLGHEQLPQADAPAADAEAA